MPTQEYKERKKAYIKDFHKKNYKTLVIQLNIRYDSDIIEILDKQPDKSKFIKKLIREKHGD